MKSLLLIVICILLFSSSGVAQLPAKEKNQVGYKNEVYGGFDLHTAGLGGTLTYAKFITYKQRRLFTLDVVNMKHPKEVKIRSYVDQNSKDFVFGKLNGVLITRLGYGKKFLKYEKLREKGVNISWHVTGGLSLAFLKPVYLDVVNILPDGTLSSPKQEAYNPEKHHLSNIYGKSRGILGLAETKVKPGGFVKFGIEFEYNDNREYVKAIETGFALDVYPQRLPIMAFTENKFLYPTLYINVLIGQRFF
ncbi:hypothetical protein [Parvicella tangerina]|uniref:Outer membrane protein beta-barrel domain-containing protein n=1 Tax=Parvicella tangerina TaxID=2829795 RepID=A0A916NSU6_9FLAO|nr:hypothetical protein [Parvicella tangerina]CAG5084502.1 hypothetical protein CRYO30217_02481 [Parvicella tangerina]